jgi:anti-anti-sigma regulatory factor
MSEPTAPSARLPAAVASQQVGSSFGILRVASTQEATTAAELRAAFDSVVAAGARNIVVELRATPTIDREVADALRAMAASLHARGALLWLAAPWPSGRGHTLRPVRDASAETMRRVSHELDRVVSTAGREPYRRS